MTAVTTGTTSHPHRVDRDPRRWVGLAVLCASLLIVVMDMTILNVALPAIAGDLRPSAVQLLWMVDVYGLAVAGLLVTASGLADRFGRKRMLIIGYVIFGAVPLLVLVVSSPLGLIGLRALLGMGGALIMPSTMSMIRDLFHDATERAVALGVWAAMAAVGGGLGPIIGGILVENFSWHAAFLFNTPIMVVGVAAATVLLPESTGRALPWDIPGIGLSIIGMATLVYAIKSFGSAGATDPAALAATAIAIITLSWFGLRCLRRRDPLMDIRLLRKPALSAGLLTALTSSVAMAAMMLLLAQWMQVVQGYSAVETGLRLLPVAVVSGVLSPLAPRIAQWIGARNVLVGGLVVGGIGFGVLYLGGDDPGYPLVVLSQSLVGMSLATLAIASAVIMSAVPADRSGNAAALEEISFELGAALGVAVLGSVAAVVFRDMLSLDALAKLGVAGADAEAARESVGGAMSVAAELDSDGRALVGQAQAAFTDALGVVGLAGGVVMLLAAAAVWWLTPRGLTVGDGH
jgi:DHA2 family multidrug resistance protein-like MFS transporter